MIFNILQISKQAVQISRRFEETFSLAKTNFLKTIQYQIVWGSINATFKFKFNVFFYVVNYHTKHIKNSFKRFKESFMLVFLAV